MEDEPDGAACVICAKPTSQARRGEIIVRTQQHPERTFHFFLHPECLRKVAKPGFVGLDQI
jgi:hypothetical protein